jgi:hypothetical protein
VHAWSSALLDSATSANIRSMGFLCLYNIPSYRERCNKPLRCRCCFLHVEDSCRSYLSLYPLSIYHHVIIPISVRRNFFPSTSRLDCPQTGIIHVEYALVGWDFRWGACSAKDESYVALNLHLCFKSPPSSNVPIRL